jgi:urease accessory protein
VPDLSAPGAGALALRRVGERTVAARARARSPLALFTPRNHGEAAWVYTTTHGGGLVGGDAISIEVEVGTGAEAVLLSQACTKIYRGEAPSAQALTAQVHAGGVLWALPDHVVPFGGASFAQRQRIELADDASLVLLDAFTSGRVGSGERWRFRRYQSRIEVHRAGRPIFLEAIDLDARTGDLAARHGRFDAFALLLLCGPAFADEAAALRARIEGEAPARGAGLLSSASSLATEPSALVMRLAATSIETLSHRVRELLGFAPGRLGDDPWARRY